MEHIFEFLRNVSAIVGIVLAVAVVIVIVCAIFWPLPAPAEPDTEDDACN